MNRITFISCVNNEVKYEEALCYLRRLHIPDGYEVTYVAIRDAKSMCEGYNRAMNEAGPGIKIYLHQDTFILNVLFLDNILEIFRSHSTAKMIGMVGSRHIPEHGIMWRGNRQGKTYAKQDNNYKSELYTEDTLVYPVEAIDGFLMITAEDIPWREDIFDSFDFYDVSQSLEFCEKGYEILVPEQENAWTLHDDGYVLDLKNYDHYRRLFLLHYASQLSKIHSSRNTDSARAYEETTWVDSSGLTDEQYIEKIVRYGQDKKRYLATIQNGKEQITDALQSSKPLQKFASSVVMISNEIKDNDLMNWGDLARCMIIAGAALKEKELEMPTFLEGKRSFEELIQQYDLVNFMLRRIELSLEDELQTEAFSFLQTNNISPVLVADILYSNISIFGNIQDILLRIANWWLEHENLLKAYLFMSVIQNPTQDVIELKDELLNVLHQ